MSIMINESTKIITQGITGRMGRMYTESCIAYAHGKSCYVAGVNPKKAGDSIFGVPIYGTVLEAKQKTGATVSVVYVPAASAAIAIWEAVEAELDLVICATEGVPMQDMVQLLSKMRKRERSGRKKTCLLGPSSPGLLIPDLLKAGVLPDVFCPKGRVGVITSSGTLSYEVVAQLAAVKMSPSAIIGLGRSHVRGIETTDLLQMFDKDEDTDAIVLISEAGNDDFMRAAQQNYTRTPMNKPVIAYVAGMSTSLSGCNGRLGLLNQVLMREKYDQMTSFGMNMVDDLTEIGAMVKKCLSYSK